MTKISHPLLIDEFRFEEFWRRAVDPVPVLIVGGGRWARVWATVLIAARGDATNVAMAARTDPQSLRVWAGEKNERHGLVIFDSVEKALSQRDGRLRHAIVASRPRDHLADGLEAIANDLHILMEKPLAPSASAGAALIEAAALAKVTLSVGTEFAYLPALHLSAGILDATAPTSLKLVWEDAAREMRHGAVKARHDEVSLLADILSHAVSIFSIFAPGPSIFVQDASANGLEARLTLSDGASASLELICSSRAEARRRNLYIRQAGRNIHIDFTQARAVVLVDDVELPLPDALRALDSTLRLEFGAFLTSVGGGGQDTPGVVLPAILTDAQSQLERVMTTASAYEACGGRSS